MTCLAGASKKSSQFTSLAMRRADCCASSVPGLVRVLGAGDLAERAGEAVETADAELERLDHVLVLLAQRAGRIERLGALDRLALRLAQAVELRLEILERRPGREDQRVQILADLGRVGADLLDVGHVVLVLRVLLVGTAGVHPEDEDDDEEDRAGDQRREAQQRSVGSGRALRDSGTAPRRCLVTQAVCRRRIVEEVEIDAVGIVLLTLGHNKKRLEKPR